MLVRLRETLVRMISNQNYEEKLSEEDGGLWWE